MSGNSSVSKPSNTVLRMGQCEVRIGLAHCRYMKLINTHLSGLVIHSPVCYDQTDSPWETLNSKTWTELYADLSEEEKLVSGIEFDL
ncbi:hypothetical protein AHF37_03490 [Paragonimus kellicotti]|nr:hypothetical protein AHF37_03490 [Paragonimus kellicotti]